MPFMNHSRLRAAAVGLAAAAAVLAAGPVAANASAAPSDVFTGKREINIAPSGTEGILSVSESGRVELADLAEDRALFVPVPTAPGSDQFMIKTGRLRVGGEALCLGVRNNGTSSLTVQSTACDASRSAQKFTFEPAGRNDSGRDLYYIGNRGAHFRITQAGALIVEETGDGPAPAAFALLDRGPSQLPDLD
ncbi:hypothetical protein [Actinoplanes sp. NPDC049265]|uniref:hypothetical protein n=1 Tax=Actinoplanes sp. NPDC049265 TaxID=3363902 RepID=UPI00371C1EF9